MILKSFEKNHLEENQFVKHVSKPYLILETRVFTWPDIFFLSL